jgi:hypothetical protein
MLAEKLFVVSDVAGALNVVGAGRHRMSKCGLIRQVSLEQSITNNAATRRAQYVVVFCKIDDEPYVETRVACNIALVSGRVENFTAQCHEIREATLNLPTQVPIVSIVCSRIDPVATATIGGPILETLLEPKRNKDV